MKDKMLFFLRLFWIVSIITFLLYIVGFAPLAFGGAKALFPISIALCGNVLQFTLLLIIFYIWQNDNKK